MKTITRVTLTAALALAMSATAQAQWKLNEIETETTGANLQFVELYNPTPNASVNGLTVINIRSSQARAISAINLTGSATGNFYLIGNNLYNTDFATLLTPAPDAVVTLDFRGQFHQTLLVNTADLPGGFVAGAAGYVFTGTEFSNGTQIIDCVQNTDGTDPELFAAQNTKVYRDAPLNTLAPYTMGRFPDGSGPWQGAGPITPVYGLSTASTPRASNTFQDPADVADWTMY